MGSGRSSSRCCALLCGRRPWLTVRADGAHHRDVEHPLARAREREGDGRAGRGDQPDVLAVRRQHVDALAAVT